MSITKEQVIENLEEVKKFIQEAEEKKEEKVVGIAIKNRFIGSIIFQSTKTTWKEAVEEANLRGANLSGANLRGVDLSGVDLREANLREADLSGANLRGANLSGANLRGVDLSGANLREADLRGVDLSGAELYHALFLGKGGTTRIKKSQVDDFFKALGVIVEE
jgi:uncharacterized protein YjbI with pentapeptide repeats